MSIREDALMEIERQRRQYDEYSPVNQCGRQLIEILKELPERASEVVLADLRGKGMTLEDCEKKINAWADAHKKGNKVCVPPNVADRIIREFYGIAEIGRETQKPAGLAIDLSQFFT